MSKYIQDAINYVQETVRQAQAAKAEEERKRQIIAEKREGYWTKLSDALVADARAWTDKIVGAGIGRALMIQPAGPTIRCMSDGDPRTVWVRRQEHCVTIGLQEYNGADEKKQTLDYDVDDDDAVQLSHEGCMLELDEVIELALEPLLFPKARPQTPKVKFRYVKNWQQSS